MFSFEQRFRISTVVICVPWVRFFPCQSNVRVDADYNLTRHRDKAVVSQDSAMTLWCHIGAIPFFKNTEFFECFAMPIEGRLSLKN